MNERIGLAQAMLEIIDPAVLRDSIERHEADRYVKKLGATPHVLGSIVTVHGMNVVGPVDEPVIPGSNRSLAT